MADAKKPPVRRSSEMHPTNESDDLHPNMKTLKLGTTAAQSMPPTSERWESDTDLAKTLKMDPPSAPPVAVPRPARAEADAADHHPAKAHAGKRATTPPARASEPPKSGIVEGIELVVVDERQSTAGERRPWRAAEVWTKRRVYGLDSTFRCVEILDRQTGRPEPTHELLGARLGGGRHREKDKVRFSYPLPLPGMEAMFSKGKKHGYTSAVERMVVRVRVLHTSPDEAQPSWDDIASRWSEPPPRA
ncbi:MAG: hypothetical protein JST00_28665 [Deltaproteobacteria bacterium]|nr:hypothetical protein [Deltaproteobacteria bacterium]